MAISIFLAFAFCIFANARATGARGWSARPLATGLSGRSPCRLQLPGGRSPCRLRAQTTMGAGDDAGEDAPASGPSPEAWRDFRKQLIAGGIKVTTDAPAEPGEPARGSSDLPERVVVAPRNEALLREQNALLYDEYVNGAWAHESAPEAGGLMCRLPLQAQLTFLMRAIEQADAEDVWGQRMREKLRTELPAEGDEAFATKLLGNTAYCYRLAEAAVIDTLRDIQERARARGGKLDLSAMKEHERQLIEIYTRTQERWQEVCLVTRVLGPDFVEGVVLNRPLAKAVDRELAELLIGAKAPGAPAPDEQLLKKIIGAFGENAGVYLGGEEKQFEAALVVHGFAALEGAKEISPGTGIFAGGLEAAADGVSAGLFAPLDFRFFVGVHTDLSTSQGAYVALSCARPVALKQCLGLPKPLWHECMELAGGEWAKLSTLEIIKRDDLQEDA
ncbi:hypothetical protein T492DRAFT_943570 [Pavlovales sp. CCMP2436]|nr:hypothetical protein T492DRAFT_943570 [Pavlovales sp. CCMP2436]